MAVLVFVCPCVVLTEGAAESWLCLKVWIWISHTHTHTLFLLSFLPFKDFERRNRPMAEAPLPPVCVLSASSCPPLVD